MNNDKKCAKLRRVYKSVMFKVADKGKMFRALIRSIPDHESSQIRFVPIRRFRQAWSVSCMFSNVSWIRPRPVHTVVGRYSGPPCSALEFSVARSEPVRTYSGPDWIGCRSVWSYPYTELILVSQMLWLPQSLGHQPDTNATCQTHSRRLSEIANSYSCFAKSAARANRFRALPPLLLLLLISLIGWHYVRIWRSFVFHWLLLRGRMFDGSRPLAKDVHR